MESNGLQKSETPRRKGSPSKQRSSPLRFFASWRLCVRLFIFSQLPSRGGNGTPPGPSPVRGERNHVDPDVRKALRRRGIRQPTDRPLCVPCRRTKKGRGTPRGRRCGGQHEACPYVVIELRKVGRSKRRDYSSNGA